MNDYPIERYPQATTRRRFNDLQFCTPKDSDSKQTHLNPKPLKYLFRPSRYASIGDHLRCRNKDPNPNGSDASSSQIRCSSYQTGELEEEEAAHTKKLFWISFQVSSRVVEEWRHRPHVEISRFGVDENTSWTGFRGTHCQFEFITSERVKVASQKNIFLGNADKM